MSKEPKPSHCLNCGEKLPQTAEYCPRCGQHNHGNILTVRELVSDFFRDYFAFDSKFFRTFRKLLASPGYITKAYTHGRRMEFLPPIRLYIVVSFVFFLLLSLTSRTNIETGRTEKIAVLDSLLRDTSSTADLQALRLRIDTANGGLFARQGVRVAFGADSTGNDKQFERSLQDRIDHILDNPTVFRSVLFRAFSISMFFVLPAFALILWMFYFRRQRYFAPHVIHSVHFHTLLFVLAIVLIFISKGAPLIGLPFPTNKIGLIFFLAAFTYLIFTLRNVYRQSFISSLFKGLLITFIYLFVLAAAMAGAAFGSLMAM